MKVLVYKKTNELKPTGGPNGYLYNLRKGLEEIKSDCVEFIEGTDESSSKENVIRYILKKFFPKIISKIRNYKNGKKWIKMINECYIKDNIKVDKKNFNNYDIIHFHSTFELYDERENLKDYKGKILLNSHSPKPAYLEYIDGLKNKKVKNIEKYYQLQKVDEFAFNRADYIIFPCEEAEEPYFNQWDKYKNIKEKNKDKYRYLLTGIPKCTAKKSRKEIRKQFNIPEDAFLVNYVGRHNEIKGYDILKEIGKKVLENNNIYFIIAGQEGPLYKLENKKWIEVGWTNDPHSIIGASDLFVLPNRETYFDLILLEVMSLGIPILASYTGGNKYFKENYKDSGIKFFENKDQAIKEIIEISKLNKDEIRKLGEKNIKIYEKDFNEKIFSENYIKMIKNLI